MYGDEELRRLALHKGSLQRGIAQRRMQCVEAAGRIARPFGRLDKAADIWRGLSPLIKLGAMPLGLLVTRLALPRRGILRSLVRWAPLAIAVARAACAATNGGAPQRPPGRQRRRTNAAGPGRSARSAP